MAHVRLHQYGTDGDGLEVSPAHFAITEGAKTQLRLLQLAHVARFRDHALVCNIEVSKIRRNGSRGFSAHCRVPRSTTSGDAGMKVDRAIRFKEETSLVE